MNVLELAKKAATMSEAEYREVAWHTLDIGWIERTQLAQICEFYENRKFGKLICLIENLCREANSCCTGNDPMLDLESFEDE